jgi:hypothetical protein
MTTEKQDKELDNNFNSFLDHITELKSTCKDWCWDKIIELAKFHKEEHEEILKGE